MKKQKILLIPVLLAFLVACGENNTEPAPQIEEPIEQITEEPELEPEPDPFYGMVINPLTGMWIDPEYSNNRPIAYIVNNLPRALPQSGISQADIIYEVLAEGGITRLVAIFTNSTADKIGPIRSTREYFSPLAINHGAVLVHHGGSPSGYSAINSLGIQNLDGIQLEGSVFWRDQVRWNAGGMREHSSYTNQENVRQNMATRGFNLESSQVYIFNFFEEYTIPKGDRVGTLDSVVLPFSHSHHAMFRFDEETGVFYRYQRNQPHWDEYTDSQITVANIIIQHAPMHVIAGDPEGRMNVNLLGSGTGYLVTAGTYAPITWTRPNLTTPTTYWDMDHNPITLNPGMTWVGILGTNVTPNFIIDHDEDEIEENL